MSSPIPVPVGRGRGPVPVPWPEEPAYRCRWPTAALAERLLSGDEPDPSGHATRAVLSAYRALLAHPVGSERMVQRLRCLRRAERGAGW